MSTGIAPDPDDDKFLALAQAGGAHWIIPGDSHLLTVGTYAGIPISSPAVFLASLDQDSKG